MDPLSRAGEDERAYGHRIGGSLLLLGVGSVLLPAAGLQWRVLVWLDLLGPVKHLWSAGMILGGAWVLWSELRKPTAPGA